MNDNIKPSEPKKYGKHWKGGKYLTNEGYVLVFQPDHHRANKQGYVLEHILVAELKFCRPVERHEEVHHIDHNKQNNHPDNLMVLSRSDHAKLHRTGKLIDCSSCGKKFYRNCYKLDKNTNNFCSKECYNNHMTTFRLTDEELINLLKDNTVFDLSRKLNIPRTTIQWRKNKLIKSGQIDKNDCKKYNPAEKKQ